MMLNGVTVDYSSLNWSFSDRVVCTALDVVRNIVNSVALRVV